MVRSSRSWVGRSFLRWEDVEHDIEILARKALGTGMEFDRIATISRGGLIPARLMADKMGIKAILVDPVRILGRTLFVDDIYDSGRTFRKMALRASNRKNLVYATLVARRGMRYPRQLIYARKTGGMEYVVFPWEKEEYSKSRKSRRSNPKNN